jgi:hypothetical protein
MVLLYGRAGRLTAKNGGFRPGQSPKNAHDPGARQFEMDAEVTPFSSFWVDGHTSHGP